MVIILEASVLMQTQMHISVELQSNMSCALVHFKAIFLLEIVLSGCEIIKPKLLIINL